MMELNWPLLCGSFCFFNLVYFTSVRLFRAFPQLHLSKGDAPYKAASRITALCHSTTLLPFLLYRLPSLHPQHIPFLSSPSPLDLSLLSFSLSYFTQDTLHFLLYEPTDTTLLLHHLISILFYTSILHTHLAGPAALAAIAMGELTNPLQCVWYLAKLCGSGRVYGVVSPVFTVAFVGMRVGVVPWWVWEIVRQFGEGWRRGEVGGGWAVMWSGMAVAMMLGSWVWSWQLSVGFLRWWTKRKGTAVSPLPPATDFASVKTPPAKFE